MLITPDIPLNERLITYTFRLSSADRMRMAIVGGMLGAAYPDQWEQVGTLTSEQAAQRVKAAILSIKEVDMIGTIVAYITTDPPKDVLPCDGSTYSASDYPQLWSVIDSTFVTGMGQFTLPDMRDRFLVGSGSGYVVGEEGGLDEVMLTESEMPNHSHDNLPHAHTMSGALASAADFGTGVPVPSAVPAPLLTGSTGITILSSGGSQAHENRPPFVAVRYGIIAQ